MSQHLVDSREHFVNLLKSQPAHRHLELARKYGWRILDISHPCGATIKDHCVDTRSSIEDDLRVKPCRKCGARGGWTHVLASKPERTKEDEKAEKAAAEARAKAEATVKEAKKSLTDAEAAVSSLPPAIHA